MFQLEVIQAEHGDCFVLNFGDENSPKHVLIDGGPKGTFKNHLEPSLKKMRDKGEKLDLIVVSHVDDDHISGVLELFLDLRNQHIRGVTKTLRIDSLWHNAFDATVGQDNDIQYRLERLSQSANFGPRTLSIINLACYSIKQGQQLNQIFKAHNIPTNPESQDKLVSVEKMPDEIVKENLSMRIVGPTEENLEELRNEWLEWLKTQKAGKESMNPFFKAMADKSFTNLSSIMILARAEGKSILFPGDGRSDHLIQGLKKTDSFNKRGELHVDLFKLPHHGSINNASKELFRKISARTYLISANGKHGHPDFTTLKYIVESAKNRGEQITLFATNRTPSLEKLVDKYPQTQYGYELSILKRDSNSAVLTP